MKKLFLTSGLVLCMACPAFASQINYTAGGNPEYALDEVGDTLGCVAPDTLTSATEATTFYAMWEAKNFSVKYYGGTAGTHALDNTTGITDDNIEFDAAYTIKNNSALSTPFAQTGYTFVNWRANYDIANNQTAAISSPYQSGGHEYAAGATPLFKVPNNDVALYAQWTPNKALIALDSARYNAAGSEVVEQADTAGTTEIWTRFEQGIYASNATAEAATTPITTITVPTLEGYTFNGYKTSKNGQGTLMIEPTDNGIVFASGLTSLAAGVAPDTDVADISAAHQTLYAYWTANQYTLRYNCGGYNQGNISKTADPEMEDATVYEHQYTFDGAGAPVYTPAQLCSLQGYHVVDNEDDQSNWHCTNTTAQQSVLYSAVATGTNGTWGIAGNVTCTLVWAPNVLELHWQTGGGTNPNSEYYAAGEGTGSCTYDLGINVGAAPTKPGYDFVGWTTNQNAEGVHNEATPTVPTNNNSGTGGSTDTTDNG